MPHSASSSKLSGRRAAGHWSSLAAFVLGAGGAAIGFNNFWQFPWLVATQGGGAFLIVYLLGVLLIGWPLLTAEFLIGRRGRLSPVGSLRRLAEKTRSEPNWAALGAIAIVAGFLILAYLCVIAGWALGYVLRAGAGIFVGQTADGMGSLFTALVRDPEKQLFWFTLFVAAALVVPARGVRPGLERLAWRAMPAVLALLGVMLLYALVAGNFLEALGKLLWPDFERLTADGVIGAVGHAFFSLGLGAGAMLMYGAYVDDTVPLARAAGWVVLLDTGVSLVAAVVVLAILGAGGVEIAAGPELVFQALPLALDHLPIGWAMGPVFFAMLVLVAWLTAVALAEPAVVWLAELTGWGRSRAALVAGVAAWALGLVMMLSFSRWAFSFRFFGATKTLGMFDVAQVVTSHFLLPVTGLLLALFAGWQLKAEEARGPLALRSPCTFDAWLWLTRLLIPAFLTILMFRLPELLA